MKTQFKIVEVSGSSSKVRYGRCNTGEVEYWRSRLYYTTKKDLHSESEEIGADKIVPMKFFPTPSVKVYLEDGTEYTGEIERIEKVNKTLFGMMYHRFPSSEKTFILEVYYEEEKVFSDKISLEFENREKDADGSSGAKMHAGNAGLKSVAYDRKYFTNAVRPQDAFGDFARNRLFYA